MHRVDLEYRPWRGEPSRRVRPTSAHRRLRGGREPYATLRPRRGVALADALIAAPLVLWLGLSIFQWGLVFHGRYAVNHALQEAARAGSVQHADPAAIELGLARGLVPYLYGSADVAERGRNLARAEAHLVRGREEGWVRWTQLSPTPASFADWGVAAVADDGQALAGQVEIPIDSLRHRAVSAQPAGGSSGSRGREAIGSNSGQTLADANLLRLEMMYGLPLSVPLVGRLAAWIMSRADGCGGQGAGDGAGTAGTGAGGPAVGETQGGGGRRLGLIDLGTPSAESGRAWACAHYRATDEQGRAQPRWPVQMSVVVRMQSPARHAGTAGVSGPVRTAAATAGEVDGARRPPTGRFGSSSTTGPGDASGSGGAGDAQGASTDGAGLGALPGGDRGMSGQQGSIFGLGDGAGRVPLGICQQAGTAG